MMKIAFDLHGTIDADPKFYSAFMQELQELGIEVWIISGPPAEQVIKELEGLGIKHYDKVVGVVSYLLEIGHKPTKVEGNNFWFDEEAWWKSKAQICKENKINCILDNEIKYAEHFLVGHPTDFVLVHKFTNGPILSFHMVTNDDFMIPNDNL